jgi:hypothetical protein
MPTPNKKRDWEDFVDGSKKSIPDQENIEPEKIRESKRLKVNPRQDKFSLGEQADSSENGLLIGLMG